MNISKIETSPEAPEAGPGAGLFSVTRPEASTLHPRLLDPATLAALRSTWATARRLRIEDALDPDLADALVDLAASHPFSFFERDPSQASPGAPYSEVRCVFWRQVHPLPDPASPAPLALHRLRRFIDLDLPELASQITGQSLRAAAGTGVAIDFYTRGSYLDAHTDQGADRLIAYVVGLTADTWPEKDGGHLEFLGPDEHTVIDRIAPGYGSLDLFTVYPLTRPHRVPLLKRAVTRLSINGWLTGELKGPGEP